MGLLERIGQDNSADQDVELEKMIARQHEAAEIAERRLTIIGDKIAEAGQKLGVTTQYLGTQGAMVYFAFDELVIVVWPFGTPDKEAKLTTVRRDVLWQHRFAVIGLDITMQPERSQHGALALLDYSSLRRCVNSAQGLEFGLQAVVAAIFPDPVTHD